MGSTHCVGILRNGPLTVYEILDCTKIAYTVSADGKTLTETGSATATKENVKVVYDRQ